MSEVELTNADLAHFEAVAYRHFKMAGLSDDDAQREAVSFGYAAAEILRDRVGEVNP